MRVRAVSLLRLAGNTCHSLQRTSLLQALIQYPDGMSATNAMQALEGHAIYDGGYNRVSFHRCFHLTMQEAE